MNETQQRPEHRTIRNVVSQAVQYLLGRESPDGGFCFYRTDFIDEPNLLDTYHATVALELTGSSPRFEESLLRFLEAAPNFGASYLFFQAFSMDALGHADRLGAAHLQAIADIEIGRPDLSTATSLSDWLERTWQAIRLKERFRQTFDVTPVVASLRGLLAPNRER